MFVIKKLIGSTKSNAVETLPPPVSIKQTDDNDSSKNNSNDDAAYHMHTMIRIKRSMRWRRGREVASSWLDSACVKMTCSVNPKTVLFSSLGNYSHEERTHRRRIVVVVVRDISSDSSSSVDNRNYWHDRKTWPTSRTTSLLPWHCHSLCRCRQLG